MHAGDLKNHGKGVDVFSEESRNDSGRPDPHRAPARDLRDDSARWRPSLWLSTLFSAKRSAWPTGRSIRAAITVGGPLLIGALVDHTLTGMWISMGTLLLAAGERSVAYPARFRQFAVTTPLAASAYLLGYLSQVPNAVTVLVMTAVAFGCGILSGYSGTLSVGTMQAMLIAAVSIGVPAADPYWKPAVLFVVGAVIYAAALGIEVLFDRRRPQRDALAAMLRALAEFSAQRANGVRDTETGRASAMSAIDAFDTMAIAARATSTGPTREYDRAAAITRAADQLLARLLAGDVDRDRCALAATRLELFASAIDTHRQPAAADFDGDTLIRVRMLENAIWGDPTTAAELSATERAHLSLPGPALLTSAARLALCTAAAYTAYYVLPVAHGYWIALTVALVMKPDLGSVFSRAVLRAVGTVAGAVLAILVGVVLDTPASVSLAIAVLAACLPWAMARSYLWQAVFLTPLIMLLIDAVVPDESLVDLSEARVVATLIGGAIVIVLGYLIWPSGRHVAIGKRMDASLSALASYARVVADNTDPRAVTDGRRATYRSLSDTRVMLQRRLSEPPPAGAQAWAWIPVVGAAERIADAITATSASRSTPAQAPSDLYALAAELDALSQGLPPGPGLDRREPVSPSHGGSSPNPHIRGLADELANLRSMLAPGASSLPPTQTVA